MVGRSGHCIALLADALKYLDRAGVMSLGILSISAELCISVVLDSCAYVRAQVQWQTGLRRSTTSSKPWATHHDRAEASYVEVTIHPG